MEIDIVDRHDAKLTRLKARGVADEVLNGGIAGGKPGVFHDISSGEMTRQNAGRRQSGPLIAF
ncbi:hypothetical protein BN129_3897 [Cronobacter sakazakii 701]|nr:hypothetical protein BN129_3897 [Cronobacter sakazakii 701]